MEKKIIMPEVWEDFWIKMILKKLNIKIFIYSENLGPAISSLYRKKYISVAQYRNQ